MNFTLAQTLIKPSTGSRVLAINFWKAYSAQTGETKGKLGLYKWIDTLYTRKRGVIYDIELVSTNRQSNVGQSKKETEQMEMEELKDDKKYLLRTINDLKEELEKAYELQASIKRFLNTTIEEKNSLEISKEVLYKKLQKQEAEMEEMKREMRETEHGELIIANEALVKRNKMLDELNDSYEATIKNLKQKLDNAGDYEYREDELKKEAAHWKTKVQMLEEELEEKDEELEDTQQVANGYATEDEEENTVRICLETIQKKYEDILNKMSEAGIEVIQLVKEELLPLSPELIEAEGLRIAEKIINEMTELLPENGEEELCLQQQAEYAEQARIIQQERMERRRQLAMGEIEMEEEEDDEDDDIWGDLGL